MHNGVYKTLEDVIRHYDIIVADYEGGFSPISQKPEVTSNIAKELMFDDLGGGGLGLDTSVDYDDLVNFMKTLSDGYVP
jgi:cytochrome c peroxidase